MGAGFGEKIRRHKSKAKKNGGMNCVIGESKSQIEKGRWKERSRPAPGTNELQNRDREKL